MEEIRNYMEVCVEHIVDRIIEKVDCCRCNKCKLDIKAIALNNLPTKYVVSEKGKVFTKCEALEQQFEVDIVSAITSASKIVSKHPRHS